jgi:hypothetical protein
MTVLSWKILKAGFTVMTQMMMKGQLLLVNAEWQEIARRQMAAVLCCRRDDPVLRIGQSGATIKQNVPRAVLSPPNRFR